MVGTDGKGNVEVADSGQVGRLVLGFSEGGECTAIAQGIPIRAADSTEHLDNLLAAVTRYQAS